MNRFFDSLYRIIIVATLSCLWLTDVVSQNKVALVIGIGDYPEESGFRDIHSENDLELIKTYLKQSGFSTSHIHILCNQTATRKRIIQQLTNIIEKELKPGDLFYFHFSGHGQQVQDKDGDEPDGLDEALAAYDARSEYIPGKYQGENHIIDDELDKYLSKARLRLGPTGNVLNTFDACHSGTATRGIGISRGADHPLVLPDFVSKENKSNTDSNKERRNLDEKKMAPMVSFFASMPHQLNYEMTGPNGKPYGALSYGFAMALKDLSSTSSYQQLFDQIRLKIQEQNNGQIPEAEGNLNQVIFGGRYLEPTQYFTIHEVMDSGVIRVDGGFLQGLRPNCKVGVYLPESRGSTTDKLLCNGTVQSSSASTCSIQTDCAQNSDQLKVAWVKITEESFGEMTIRIETRVDPKSSSRSLVDSIYKLPFVTRSSTEPDLILTEQNDSIILANPYNIQVISSSNRQTFMEQYLTLTKAIRNFGQTQFIRRLNLDNKDIRVQFEIILANQGLRAMRKSADELIRSDDGRIIFKAGDSIQIRVMNTGKVGAYFSLLDIQPDYILNVLMPGRKDSPADYYVDAGQSKTLPPIFKLEPPFGQELFKLIASRNPINLRPLGSTRAANTTQDPFEALFNSSYYSEDTGTRGRINTLPSGQVNIFSIPFNIEN